MLLALNILIRRVKTIKYVDGAAAVAAVPEYLLVKEGGIIPVQVLHL